MTASAASSLAGVVHTVGETAAVAEHVARTLGRKAAGEFEKKVLFQMSAADSASLIDTGKASELGLNRALFYDEPTGTVEIFRPFTMPGMGWFG